MALRNIFGESEADSAAEHTVPIKSNTSIVNFQSLTITTYGADISKDVKVTIKDGSRERWGFYLRNGVGFGAHFDDIGDIIIANGSCSISTGAAGTGVIVSASAVCELK